MYSLFFHKAFLQSRKCNINLFSFSSLKMFWNKLTFKVQLLVQDKAAKESSVKRHNIWGMVHAWACRAHRGILLLQPTFSVVDSNDLCPYLHRQRTHFVFGSIKCDRWTSMHNCGYEGILLHISNLVAWLKWKVLIQVSSHQYFTFVHIA